MPPNPFETLSAAALANRFGVSEEEVRRRELAGELYGFRRAGGPADREYPAFQAWPEAHGLPRVLAALGGVAGPTAHFFCSAPNEFLGGLTPVDALTGQVHGSQAVSAEGHQILLQPAPRRLAAVVGAAQVYAADLAA